MNDLKQRVFFGGSSLWLSVIAMLLVFGWRGWVIAHKPPHLMAMAEELGSIGEFQGGFWSDHADIHLYPNHSNTGVVFAQHTERGVGIFFCNTADGKKKLICEQPEKGWSYQSFGMLGWSPNDHFFACALPTPHSHLTPEEILICEGTSGQIVARLPGDVKTSQLAWLTPHSFAYSYLDVNGYYLNVFEQKSEKDWVQPYKFLKLGKGVTGLVATSAKSVAYCRDQSLWTLDVATGTPQKIWGTVTNQLQSFTYANETGDFYLSCTNETGPFQICFRPPTMLHPEGTVLDNSAFTDNKTNSAVLRNESGLNAFYIKAAGKPTAIRYPWQGQVMNYQVNGDYLYVTGDRTNQPPGIWKYNFNSGACDQIVSALDVPLKYAQLICASSGIFTNSAGRQANYLIWQPTRLVAGKKYPLIIGQTPYSFIGWVSYPQIAANSGCYFVFIERPAWFDGLENWGEDVMTAYDLMAKNPNVDTSQVYLFGASAETSPLSQLLSEKPSLWRGALLFNPSAMPDASTATLSKLLILDGADGDADNAKRLTDYQDQAARQGIAVNVVLVNGAQHIFKSSASERQKTLQIARFLFGN